MNQSQIEQFLEQLHRAMPNDFITMKSDIKQYLRAALSATLSKMELITREEFEVQSRLLARTRQRLEEMQKRIEKLEQQDH